MPTPSEQLLSRTVYDIDGTTTVWDFSFAGGYLDATHVKAYTELANGARTPVVVTPEMLIGEFQLQITPALPSASGLLVIYRDTPKDLPLVNFVEGPLSEIALDTNAKQAVFIAAEAQDVNGGASQAIQTAIAASVTATEASQEAQQASQEAQQASDVAAEAASRFSITEVVDVVSTSTALVVTDRGKLLRVRAPSPSTVSITAGQTFPAGYVYHVSNRGVGNLTITVPPGLVVNPPKEGTLVLEPGDFVSIHFVFTDVADVYGSTKAAV